MLKEIIQIKIVRYKEETEHEMLSLSLNTLYFSVH